MFAVISIGPVMWNAVISLVLFFLSLFLGIMLDPMFPKFSLVLKQGPTLHTAAPHPPS